MRLLFIFFFVGFICPASSFSQPKKYTVENAHAHNDYEHERPFYEANEAGFGSIEADVYPVNGDLLVAHNSKDVNPEKTLTTLYLNPIKKVLSESSKRKIRLLIDIKTDYAVTLLILVKQLEGLKKYCSLPGKSNRLTILISGNRPKPEEYKNYPLYILFDDDWKVKHTSDEWKRVGMVSIQFSRYAKWNGQAAMNEAEKTSVKSIIDSVHAKEKPIRFWAAPDNALSWKTQMELGADYIGTDKIGELGEELKAVSH